LITENRLRTLARKNKVTTGLMEKDYVNSWILYSIFNNEQMNQKLVFKGGTLLHKIYFPEKWRFSEDLDLTAAEDIDLEKFKENLQHSLSECSSLSGIGFEITSFHSNPGYIQIKIQYDALLGQKNTTSLDLSLEEKILFETVWKKHSLEDILNNYGDLIVENEAVSPILAAAIGDYGFILRTKNIEKGNEAVEYILAKL